MASALPHQKYDAVFDCQPLSGNIKESTAAALGLVMKRPGSKVLVVDIGFGTLDLSLVSTVAIGGEQKNLRTQVLAKSDAYVGSVDIDIWIVEDYLRKSGSSRTEVGGVVWQNLLEIVERLKIKLSKENEAKESWLNEETFTSYELQLSRDDLEKILGNRQFYKQLSGALDEVLEIALTKGISQGAIEQVLLVDRSCLISTVLISTVQKWIISYFKERGVKLGKFSEIDTHGALVLMANNSNLPREYDAILGGHAPAPYGGVVLGGIEGVKRRLASASVEQRIAALSEALKYGEAGLYLVVQAFLWNESDEVKQAAYLLLRRRAEPIVKQIIWDFEYQKLQDLLAAGKWKEADQKTLAIMLHISDREKESWLCKENIERFPSKHLRTINRLWTEYSNGRFGFSVQMHIWQSVGGSPSADYEKRCCFSERVGWRMKSDWVPFDNLTFSLEAPFGHLPTRRQWTDSCFVEGDGGFWGFFSRVDSCQFNTH